MDKMQVMSYELSFTGGKMRIAAQDTAFQIVLRNCSEEAREEARIYMCSGSRTSGIIPLLLWK